MTGLIAAVADIGSPLDPAAGFPFKVGTDVVTNVARAAQGAADGQFPAGILFPAFVSADTEVIGVIKAARFQVLTIRWRKTSLEMVEGSLQRYFAISRKERWLLRDPSINCLSAGVRCFWFPGIKFDIINLLYRHRETVKRIQKERRLSICV